MRFSEILAIATLTSGSILAVDALIWKHTRMLGVLDTGQGRAAKEPWLVEFARSFFPVLLVVFILRSFLFEPFRIPSSSMVPTLLIGDFILVNKFEYGLRMPISNKKMVAIKTPKRGDMVVFRKQDKDVIKRVVGLPGDHISYRDKRLYINHVLVPTTFTSEHTNFEQGIGPVTYKSYSENLLGAHHSVYLDPSIDGARMLNYYRYSEATVPADSYYVLGDNRDKSEDSRFWGFVKDEDIQGRAFAVLLSWDNIHKMIRWERLGTRLN